MYRIFVVEDDAVIASAVQRHLESWGYQVACAVRFDDVLSDFAAFDPQLVLLDISLPFFNGYHWCREIRKVSKVPILFLTSASDDMNLVMAMEMGGDDLLAKPFHLQVLSAKVQAMLRRAYDFAGTAHLLSCGGAVLNVSDGTLTANGQKVELTRNEFKILQLLLEHRGEIVSREAIMTRLWESDSFVDENTLTVNIANETRQAFRGAVRPYLCRGDRTVLDEQRCEVTVEALSSLDVLRRKVDAADVYDTYLYADLYDASGSFLTRRTQLLVPPKHFSWRKPRLTVTAEDIPGGVAFRVSADAFAKNVYLDFRDRDLVLSDNYFDLTAPEAYTVTAQTQASAAELLPQLTVKTVYDIR